MIHIHTNYKLRRPDESSEGACFTSLAIMKPTLDLGDCSKLKMLLVCLTCRVQSASSLCCIFKHVTIYLI